FPAAVSLLVGLGFFYLALPKLPAYGQISTATSNQNPPVASVVNESVRPRVAPPALSSTESKTAAAENVKLKYSLEWAFGGKAQRGWYLYVPLIQQLIETEQGAETPDFALALADWQKGAELPANGILDDKTLYKMI